MRSQRGAGRDGDGAVASRSAACVSDHRALSPRWSDQAGRRCVAKGSRRIVGERSRRGSGERRIPRGVRGETEGDSARTVRDGGRTSHGRDRTGGGRRSEGVSYQKCLLVFLVLEEKKFPNVDYFFLESLVDLIFFNMIEN